VAIAAQDAWRRWLAIREVMVAGFEPKMEKRLFQKPVARVLFALFPAVAAAPLAAAAEPPGASLVVVAEVVQRQVAEGRTFVGTVLPSRRSVIGSAVEGRVLDLLVNDGDWVEAGATLAELRTVTIKLELEAAKAELELRKHALDESKSSLPIEKEQAKAALARTQALSVYAKSRLTRAEALYAKGGTTSQEELEQNRSVSLAADQSALEAAAAYQLLLRPRDEKILQAEAQVDKQEAEVARLEDQLEKYTIRAPFEGYVTAEHTEDGAWIKQGEPVVELVSVDPMEVSVSVPEEYIAALRPGMPASLQLDALPARLVPAEISRIVPQADVRSRSFPVKMVVSNPRDASGHTLKAGMLARVTLAVAPPKQAMLVPKDALVLGGPVPVVYVVVADPQTRQLIASPVPVQLGVADGDQMQVLGNLQVGQRVVVRGNERLAPGAPVVVADEPRQGTPKSAPAQPSAPTSASSPAKTR
jgi:RND family efflux transporter MFP subunit